MYKQRVASTTMARCVQSPGPQHLSQSLLAPSCVRLRLESMPCSGGESCSRGRRRSPLASIVLAFLAPLSDLSSSSSAPSLGGKEGVSGVVGGVGYSSVCSDSPPGGPMRSGDGGWKGTVSGVSSPGCWSGSRVGSGRGSRGCVWVSGNQMGSWKGASSHWSSAWSACAASCASCCTRKGMSRTRCALAVLTPLVLYAGGGLS